MYKTDKCQASECGGACSSLHQKKFMFRCPQTVETGGALQVFRCPQTAETRGAVPVFRCPQTAETRGVQVSTDC